MIPVAVHGELVGERHAVQEGLAGHPAERAKREEHGELLGALRLLYPHARDDRDDDACLAGEFASMLVVVCAVRVLRPNQIDRVQHRSVAC